MRGRGVQAVPGPCPRVFIRFGETLDKFSVVLYAALDKATFKAPKAGRRAGKGRKGEKGGDREQGPGDYGAGGEGGVWREPGVDGRGAPAGEGGFFVFYY